MHLFPLFLFPLWFLGECIVFVLPVGKSGALRDMGTGVKCGYCSLRPRSGIRLVVVEGLYKKKESRVFQKGLLSPLGMREESEEISQQKVCYALWFPRESLLELKVGTK